MKTLCTFTLLLFCSLTFAQTDTDKITKIRKMVEKINKDTGYTTKTLDGEQFMEHVTDGGGQLTGYFKDGHVVKIIETIGLSSCINTTEHYLQDDRLIFSYTRGEQFKYLDSTATFSTSIKSLKMECRFYFDNDKMIKSILKGATMCSGQPKDSWAKSYQDDCVRYSKLLKTK